MLLAVVHLGYQHVLRRPAPDVFHPNAFDFHVHWHASRDFGDVVVQARLYVGLFRARAQPVVCGDPRLIREVGGPDLAWPLNIPVS